MLRQKLTSLPYMKFFSSKPPIVFQSSALVSKNEPSTQSTLKVCNSLGPQTAFGLTQRLLNNHNLLGLGKCPAEGRLSPPAPRASAPTAPILGSDCKRCIAGDMGVS